MYEPYEFTSYQNFQEGRHFVYPGMIKTGYDEKYWDRGQIESYFSGMIKWAKKNKIRHNRIVAGEFGCYRRNTGCKNYLTDVISVLNENWFHWAFYAFREDAWDGYDYEFGKKYIPWEFGEAEEQDKSLSVQRSDNPIFDVIKRALK